MLYLSPPCCFDYLLTFNVYHFQNQRPTGRDTSAVPRPPLGDVRISGAGIYDCVNAGEIALTFDDGPYLYTSDLLDKFAVRVPGGRIFPCVAAWLLVKD